MILYVVGDSPSIGAVNRFLASQWDFASKPAIYYHNDGYFVIKFHCCDDRDQVMRSGPHMINNRPVILKPWSAHFNFSDEILKTIPLWVRFPNLLLNCWEPDSLSRLASGLGTPLCADECTLKMERISYARVLIEMDITVPLPTSVKILDSSGKTFDQVVDYEWWPQYCPVCCQIGHVCPVQPPKKVQPKQNKREPRKTAQVWHGKVQQQPAKDVVVNAESASHPTVNKGWMQVHGKAAGKKPVPNPTEEQLEVDISNDFTH
ncbi:uncharacterized protein LOC132624755 [Lycium barbarum]|uniref:uncharacterized protein LOC132624755 n=1 Tax=Lycium barbarum TaxID=112863 RepID=UPI00293EAF91|nr:uncharacterized protein LOC132624755 [Lycium barbarum]